MHPVCMSIYEILQIFFCHAKWPKWPPILWCICEAAAHTRFKKHLKQTCATNTWKYVSVIFCDASHCRSSTTICLSVMYIFYTTPSVSKTSYLCKFSQPCPHDRIKRHWFYDCPEQEVKPNPINTSFIPNSWKVPCRPSRDKKNHISKEPNSEVPRG